MKIDLTGRTAVVTGGGVGIGRDCAIALAEAGAGVAITRWSHEPDSALQASIARSDGSVISERLDVTDAQSISPILARVAGSLGDHIDILVNNSGGLVGRQHVDTMSLDFWREVIDLNLNSVFYVTKAVLPYMTSGWGRVVNIASLAGQNGGSEGVAAYAAAKAGVSGFTRALAKELATRGITVNAVAPGLILGTPFHDKFTPLPAQKATIARTPLSRAGTTGDVAGCVTWLASDMAGFVTGAVIDVNGGQYFH